jgi:hypothetical protein
MPAKKPMSVKKETKLRAPIFRTKKERADASLRKKARRAVRLEERNAQNAKIEAKLVELRKTAGQE